MVRVIFTPGWMGVLVGVMAAAPLPAAEVLYNGIELPAVWPPRSGEDYAGRPPPYLAHRPAVVPIDLGRQLFVDDFLVDATDLKRTFHHPVKFAGNPLLIPETAAEKVGGKRPVAHYWRSTETLDSTACPFDDGVFYDPSDHRYKLWYTAGTQHDTALAYSSDGLKWERPVFDVVPGTNIVIPYDPAFARDAFSPWIDLTERDPRARFKGYIFQRSSQTYNGGWLLTSPDGIHWTKRKQVNDIGTHDNTLLFRNPFRDKWALSIAWLGTKKVPSGGSARGYYESGDFFGLAGVKTNTVSFWDGVDALDKPIYWAGLEDPAAPGPTWIKQRAPQLYTISAAPYESLMLGLFTVHTGPDNFDCEKGGFPKLTQVEVAFSRDGFYWDRPDRSAFIAPSRHDGAWDRGYVRAAGGGCLVVGDRLYFYYAGFSGYTPDHKPGMYSGGSTHVAMLRRDGFASLDAPSGGGEVTTHPVRFQGSHLFVNLDAPHGQLTAEAVDEQGAVIEPFSAANCVPVHGDGTKLRVTWKGGANLSALAGRPIRFKFHLTRGSLYSFWVSRAKTGESAGYVAAGGPGFAGATDSAQ